MQVCIYIAAFASTWGPVAWVVTGEIFPLAIRGKAMSMSVASNWLWNFGIGYATPYLVNPSTTGVNGTKVSVYRSAKSSNREREKRRRRVKLTSTSFSAFPPSSQTANLGVKVFFLWGATCCLCIVFTYFLVPETKGLSLEQGPFFTCSSLSVQG